MAHKKRQRKNELHILINISKKHCESPVRQSDTVVYMTLLGSKFKKKFHSVLVIPTERESCPDILHTLTNSSISLGILYTAGIAI